MLTEEFLHFFSEILKTNIIKYTPLFGGDINKVYLIESSSEKWVVKVNNNNSFPNMFKYEEKGLKLLDSPQKILVAKPIKQNVLNNDAFLILKHIPEGIKTELFWENFGIQLNNLHQTSHQKFGLHFNNYIGSLPQQNEFCDSWTDFFVTQRIEAQLKLAREKGFFKTQTNRFSSLFSKLENLFPQEPPALLHGDLWSGNFLVGKNENPVLIDPAPYFGHREMDIGMTMLFGGFDNAFYKAYNAQNPLEKHWEERLPLAQLYPLLVHVNLFGSTYVNAVEDVLNRFA